MGERLTDQTIRKLATPVTGNVIHFDSQVGGLGVRITAAGARSFVLCYRNKSGRQRRLTIGTFGEWTIGAARAEAKEFKRQIDQGDDPLGERIAHRDAPSMAELCKRFLTEHVERKRPATKRDYTSIVNTIILPELKSLKVPEVSFSDIDRLHRKVTKAGAPYRANRTVAVLSKMFSLAIQWKMRSDNPAKAIERNDEDKRERYLSHDELNRLGKVLIKCPDKQGATIIGLLLLTGARSGELRSVRWTDLDLKIGTWTKPSSHTKQKKIHRIPLSAPALALLRALRAETDKSAVYVFPGNGSGGYRSELKKTWRQICKAAHLKDMRIHDLRHSHASILASSGHSLPVIGRLLGHTQATTTARYTHLLDDVLRQATEKVGEIVTNGH